MTPSELKASVIEHNPESHYFDRNTMKFFGDTMRNYGVRTALVKDNVECWELYRKRPVNNGLHGSVYFDKITFKRVFPYTLEHAENIGVDRENITAAAREFVYRSIA